MQFFKRLMYKSYIREVTKVKHPELFKKAVATVILTALLASTITAFAQASGDIAGSDNDGGTPSSATPNEPTPTLTSPEPAIPTPIQTKPAPQPQKPLTEGSDGVIKVDDKKVESTEKVVTPTVDSKTKADNYADALLKEIKNVKVLSTSKVSEIIGKVNAVSENASRAKTLSLVEAAVKQFDGKVDKKDIAEFVDENVYSAKELQGVINNLEKEKVNLAEIYKIMTELIHVENILADAEKVKKSYDKKLDNWREAKDFVPSVNKAANSILVYKGKPSSSHQVANVVGRYQAITSELAKSKKYTDVVNVTSTAVVNLSKKSVYDRIIIDFVKDNIKSSKDMGTVIKYAQKNKVDTADLVKYQAKLKKEEVKKNSKK